MLIDFVRRDVLLAVRAHDRRNVGFLRRAGNIVCDNATRRSSCCGLLAGPRISLCLSTRLLFLALPLGRHV
jgi:hypothetical protein